MPPKKMFKSEEPSQSTSCANDAKEARRQQPNSCAVDQKETPRQQCPSWSQLPTNALRRIYQGLADADRAKMARVTKSWSQGFRDAELWRSRAVEFGRKPEYKCDFEETGRERSNSPNSSRHAPRRFTSCFRKMPPLDSDGMINDFATFATKLDQANLRKLCICHAKLYIFEGQKRTHLIDSLMRLIRNQRGLQTFRVESIYFDRENGLNFLKRLADGSGASIQTLYLKGFFMKKVPMYRERRVIKEMEKFTRLAHIHMDYSMVSEQLIKLWGQGCPTLSYLTLGAKKFVARENVISRETWQALLSTHPNLLFELHFKKIESTRQMLPLLAPCLPMFKLNWESMDVITPERDVISLLHLVASYHATIKHIFFIFQGEFPNIDTILAQKILSTCKRLRPFSCDHIRIMHWMAVRQERTESEVDWDNWHF